MIWFFIFVFVIVFWFFLAISRPFVWVKANSKCLIVTYTYLDVENVIQTFAEEHVGELRWTEGFFKVHCYLEQPNKYRCVKTKTGLNVNKNIIIPFHRIVKIDTKWLDKPTEIRRKIQLPLFSNKHIYLGNKLYEHDENRIFVNPFKPQK